MSEEPLLIYLMEDLDLAQNCSRFEIFWLLLVLAHIKKLTLIHMHMHKFKKKSKSGKIF